MEENNHNKLKHIVIVGTSGCGKTTLAKKLSRLLNIPCIDLDDYYWLPEWQIRDKEEFQKIVDNLSSQEYWIISGNYSKVKELIWGRSDTIIWLDYSIVRCLYQGLYRSIKRSIFREPCCGNNFEGLTRAFFSRNSILLWIITTFTKRKTAYNEAFKNKIEGKTYLKFKCPNETNTWINGITKNWQIGDKYDLAKTSSSQKFLYPRQGDIEINIHHNNTNIFS